MPHRPWSTIMLAIHWLEVVGASLLLGIAVLAFVLQAGAPAPEEGEINEAWGLVIGAIAGTAGAVLFVPGLGLLLLTRRGRRLADHGRPGLLRGCGIFSLAVGAIGAVAASAGSSDGVGPGLVLSGLYAAPGVLVLVTARPRDTDGGPVVSSPAPDAWAD